nr:hypothetical protein [uncultured Friedmanniella sp.]
MNFAEWLLLLAVVFLPLVLGAAAALARKPWWWAAVVAVVLAMAAMIAPEPEAGQARLAWGDVAFVLVISVFVTVLVWLSNFVVRKFWVRPAASGVATR